MKRKGFTLLELLIVIVVIWNSFGDDVILKHGSSNNS